MRSATGPVADGLRDATQRLGLWPILRTARTLLRRELGRWVEAGCPSPPPGVVKIAVVRAAVREWGIRRFIETGTFFGAMTDAIARLGVEVDSIELDPNLYNRARRIFSNRQNIRLHLGDSAVVLPSLLAALEEPALFWLDAHYSGGITARGEVDTPISGELDAILRHRVRGHVLLIDDARCFDGHGGYPHLHRVLEAVVASGEYRISVSTDIIRVTPVGR